MVKLVVVFLMMMVCATAWATDYYVDYDGGDNGNSGLIGFPKKDIQNGSNLLAVAGDKLYIKARAGGASYDLAAIVTFNTAPGTTAAHIEIIGYTTTITDGGKPLITQTGAVASVFTSTQVGLDFKNFTINGGNNTTTSLITLAGASSCTNMDFLNPKDGCDYGINFSSSSGGSVFNCSIEGGNKIDIYGINQPNRVVGCYVTDIKTVGNAISLSTDAWAVSCAVSNCPTAGFRLNAGNIHGCSIYNCGIGVNAIASGGIIANTIIEGCTTPIAGTSKNTFAYNVALFNNTNPIDTDITNLSPITLTASPFTNTAIDDYTLNTNAGGGLLCKNTGVPLTLNSYNVGLNVGAMQNYTSSTAPTFSGIKQLEAVGGGCLRATWDAGTGTITTYNVYVRKGSSTNLFTATYLKAKIDSSSTECIFRTEADNMTFMDGTEVVYVGVRAENDGTEDANTTSLYVIPTGDGTTYINMNDIVAIGV